MAVDEPAGTLHESDVLDLVDVGRTLEHEVLEEMGEPGPPFRLRPETHVVQHRYIDERTRAIGGDDDAETVAENGALKARKYRSTGGHGGQLSGRRPRRRPSGVPGRGPAAPRGGRMPARLPSAVKAVSIIVTSDPTGHPRPRR